MASIALLLGMCGYEQNLFLTYQQLQSLGGRVNKGEKAHMVVYWKIMEKEQEGTETKKVRIPMQLLRMLSKGGHVVTIEQSINGKTFEQAASFIIKLKE